MLFAEWILTEGQRVIEELGRDTARADLLTIKGIRRAEIDLAELTEHGDLWRDRYERLLRLGKAGPTDS